MEEKMLEKLGGELIDILGFEEQESGTIDEETFLQIQKRIENMSDLERVRRGACGQGSFSCRRT
jgi:hypothetical protein